MIYTILYIKYKIHVGSFLWSFSLFLLQEERTFSDEEEEKLQTALGVAGSDLELIIETLEFVLQQVAPLFSLQVTQSILLGAGIAQWLERRTRDWKVAGSNPCWNGGRIFFSRVDFLCWLLFRYPFHPRVTTVARKKSRSFCQKCRCQVTAKHAYTLRMWILLNRASALVTTCP